MSRNGRFIPAERVDAFVNWDFGDVDPAVQAVAQWELAAEENLEAQRQQAFDDGFAAGLRQAQEEAAQALHETADAAAARLAGLAGRFADQLQASREQVADTLLDLACEIARQVVRSELQARPDALRAVAQEALSLIAEDAATRTVRLHPQDLALMEASLSTEPATATVHWRADPQLAPGDCVVEGGGAIVDATVGKRWARAVAKLGINTAWQEQADAAA